MQAINASDASCMAQTQHGSAPDIAGQDKANPTSVVLSAAMLLEWLSTKHQNDAFARAHKAMDAAVGRLLADAATRMADLGGKLGTSQFADALCREVERGARDVVS